MTQDNSTQKEIAMLTNLLDHLQIQITNAEKGQDLAEYAVFIGLIALVVVVSMTIIGGGISNVFMAIATAIQNGL
jgi:Flp pilus assembly pilin Flp